MKTPRCSYRRVLLLALPGLIGLPLPAWAQSPWPSAGPPAAAGAQPSPFDQPASAPKPSPFDQPASGPKPSPFDQPARGMTPPPGAGPMSGMAPPQEPPPCLREFAPLRDEVDKRGKAIQSAASRKATPQEACGLFTSYVAANLKMLKYAQTNSAKCGIPAEVINQIKQGYGQGETIRVKVCQAAKMQQQAPAGPSLGDALGASQVPNAGNVKSGRGTFDTLTGTPLGTPK